MTMFRAINNYNYNYVEKTIAGFAEISPLWGFSSVPQPFSSSPLILLNQQVLPLTTAPFSLCLCCVVSCPNTSMARTSSQFHSLLPSSALIILLWAFLQVQSTVPPAERTTLVNLYDSTNGPEWADKGNWLSGDPCTNKWYAVGCDSEHVIHM